MEDLIKTLGYMALGTRLKRIGDILQTQTQIILDKERTQSSLPIPPASHHAILMAITRYGPMSIGNLALALCQSQPGVTRMVRKLESLGLVARENDPSDQRISVIALTPEGARTTEGLKTNAWPKVDRAVAEACRADRQDFLATLEALEDALAEVPLAERMEKLDAASPAGALASTPNPLDRPVWNSLITRHAGLSLGGPLAKRFQPDVSPFASAPNQSAESARALSALLDSALYDDGQQPAQLYMMQVEECILPDDLTAVLSAKGVQLVKQRPSIPLPPRTDIIRLGKQDHAEMISLAHLTKPGPFLPRTPDLGTFWGIRINGRLAAMAGQRMSLPGYVEVSGVCTHPDFRGQGLAAALSDTVAREIEAAGDTPFLHAWADNAVAIRLYQKLGFDLRTEMNICVLEKKHDPC